MYCPHTVIAAAKAVTTLTPDSLGVAAINATILSIFFAAASVYALFIFQGLHTLKTEVINLANRINEFRWGTSVPSGFANSYVPDEEGRKIAGRRLRLLLLGHDPSPADAGPPVGRTPADRGEEVLGVMCAICSHYPFPAPWKKTEGGTAFDSNTPEPVSLSKLQEIDRWVADVSDLAPGLLWAVDTHPSSLGELMTAVGADLRAQLGPITVPETGYSMGQSADVERMVRTTAEADWAGATAARFAASIRGALQLANEVHAKREEMKRFAARLPKLRHVLSLLGIAAVIAVTGVLIPMTWPNVTRVVSAWIPAGCYLAALAAMFLALIRAYRREEVKSF